MKTRCKRPQRPVPQGNLGLLPAQAPLANPYVPFQETDPPKYEARKALIRGTLYPGLDLPLLGMVNEKPGRRPRRCSHRCHCRGW